MEDDGEVEADPLWVSESGDVTWFLGMNKICRAQVSYLPSY